MFVFGVHDEWRHPRPRCKQPKDIELFREYTDNRGKRRRHTWCQSCQAESAKLRKRHRPTKSDTKRLVAKLMRDLGPEDY